MKTYTRFTAVVLALLFAYQISAAAADKPADTWERDLLSWRTNRAQSIAAPEGWLSVVGLEWLEPGDNTIGAAADNRIRLENQTFAHLGTIRLEQGKLTLVAPSGGFPKDLAVSGHAPAQSEPISADDAAKPSKIVAGTLAMTVIHRGDRYGLRIKDSATPARTNFHGLQWYEPNPAYRVRARWTPYEPARQTSVPTVLGTTVNMTVPGVAEFIIDGKTVRLEPVLESSDDKELFFILRDTTSKRETYGAGRFLYTELPDKGLSKPGELWLDFNRATNPPCAYTPYATCPLPPPQNRLQVAIPAGEKRFHE